MSNTWHNSQVTMIGVLLTLVVSTGAGFYNAGIIKSDVTAISKAVETIKPIGEKQNAIIERVVRLETIQDGYGKLFVEVKDTLKEVNKTMKGFGDEQNRRTSRIDNLEDHVKDHKRGH